MHHHHSADCSCSATADATKVRSLWVVFFLLSGLSLAELLVGLSSHSLALLADGGHMVADELAIAMALLATWLGQLPASERAPFGYRRVEILAALVNGGILVAIALWIGWEAVQRLPHPPEEIASQPMLIVALVGLGVNSLNAWLLHRGSEHDLNVRAVFLHVLADAVSSLGVVLAAIAVWLEGWRWVDSAISLGVSGLILAGAVPLIARSLTILLEQAPNPQRVAAVRSFLATFEAISTVKALRLWTIATGLEVLCLDLEVELPDAQQRDLLLRQLQTHLKEKFGIQEVMVQMTAASMGRGNRVVTTALTPVKLESLILNRDNG